MWKSFAKFCAKELATGGPDPQIAMLEALSKDRPLNQRIWLIGCYGSHHCVPSAYLVWSRWSARRVIEKPKSFARWLEDHWDGLPVRPEMRSHRMVEKRAKCLTDFAVLAQSYEPKRWKSYDEAWIESQKEVKFYARYMAIKVLEMLHRFGDSSHLKLPDMRAKGGWSPRQTLGMLWSEHADTLQDRNDNSPGTIALVESVFGKTREILRGKYDVRVSNFQLQVLLCEYKEWRDGGYYPGASLDEELEYIALSRRVFGKDAVAPLFKVRKQIFPHENLKELR